MKIPAPLEAHLPVLLLCAAGATLPLVRVLADPFGSLPGSAYSDVYKHTWSYSHTLQQLGSWSWPWTDMLGAPEGGWLLDVMLGPSLVMLPVTALLGPVFSANLWVWLSLLAVGLSTAALARESGASSWSAAAAGLLAQSAPYLLGYPLMSGVHERLAVWVFPLILLSMLRLHRTRRLRWVFIPGAAMVWVAVGSPVYGLMAAMVMVLAAPLALWPQPDRGRVGRLALSAGVALLGMVVLLLFVRWLWAQPELLVPPVHLGETLWEGRQPTTWSQMLHPLVAARVQPWTVHDELWFISYLGLVPVLGGLAGGLVAWRQRRWAAVVALGISLVFAALALGPTVSVLHHPLVNPVVWPAQHLVPMWSSLVPVWQHVAVASALLPVPLVLLVDRAPAGGARWLATGLVVALVLGERVAVCPVPLVLPTAPGRVSSVYEAVDAPGPLVDLPLRWKDTELSRGEVFLAQSMHGQPILPAINPGFAPWDDFEPLVEGRDSNWVGVGHCLRAGGFRWLVLRYDQLPNEEAAWHILQELERIGAKRRAQDGTSVLMDLGPIEGSWDLPTCPAAPENQQSRGGNIPRGAPRDR